MDMNCHAVALLSNSKHPDDSDLIKLTWVSHALHRWIKVVVSLHLLENCKTTSRWIERKESGVAKIMARTVSGTKPEGRPADKERKRACYFCLPIASVCGSIGVTGLRSHTERGSTVS
jgi:hypothetical protein